eukprot:14749_1
MSPQFIHYHIMRYFTLLQSHNIHQYQQNCIHIKNLLSIDEQIKLWNNVNLLSSNYKIKHKLNDRCNFYKLLNNGINGNDGLKLSRQFYDIIDNACLMASNVSESIPSTFKPEYVTCYKYESIDGKLPGHVDKKSGWVLLTSLGESCIFYINGPETFGKKTFEFESGDCLLFDSSKTANIYHGIDSICNNTIPYELKLKCPELCNWRVSVQMRAYGYGAGI